MKRRIMTAALFLCAAAAAGCGDKSGPGSGEFARPVVEGIDVEEVRLREVQEFYRASGTVRSKTTALVSSKIMGQVARVPVEVGDRVNAGQTLLVLSSPDIAAKAQAAGEAVKAARKQAGMAEENEVLAQRTFERFEKLFEGRAVTEQEFDEVRTRREIARLEHERAQNALRVAEARREEARAFSDYTVITSPLGGVAAERYIDKGSMAAPGAPLFMIEEPAYRVEIPVDEGFTGRITVDMPVDITPGPSGNLMEGRVGEIVHQIDPATRTFTVKIDVIDDGQSLRGGMYAEAAFPVGLKQALLVPAASIVTRGELTGLYTVNDDGVISLRLVRIGRREDGLAEVLSGLSAGERIIVRGVSRAVDGGVLAGAGKP